MTLAPCLRKAFLSGDHFRRVGSPRAFGFDPHGPKSPPLDVPATIDAMAEHYGPDAVRGDDWELVPPDTGAIVEEIRRQQRTQPTRKDSNR